MAEVPLNYAGPVPTSGRDIDDTASKVVTDTVNRGSFTKMVPLLSVDKTTTGAGTSVEVKSFKTLRVEVWGTGTYTVQIQAVGPSGTARTLQAWDNANNQFANGKNITAAGFYDIDVQGYTSVKANVTAISGGNVNASGLLMA